MHRSQILGVEHARGETGSGRLLRRMASWGVTHAFVVPGASLSSVMAEMAGPASGVRPVVALHEAMAGAMADGFARRSGRPGVAMAVGGPGAGYLAGSVAAAVGDDVPVLYVTGHKDEEEAWVKDSELFRARGALGVTASADGELPGAMRRVEESLASGVAAHLSIGMGVQEALQSPGMETGPAMDAWEPPFPRELLDEPRLAVAVGAGALGHAEEIRQWAEACGVPVMTDTTARGVLPDDSPGSLGHLGFMPDPRAWAAIRGGSPWRARTVLALGAGPQFMARLRGDGMHVEPVPAHAVGTWLRGEALHATGRPPGREEWVAALAGLARPIVPGNTGEAWGHARLVAEVAAVVGPGAVHCLDAGHFHLVGPGVLSARGPRTVLSPSGLIAMGWSLGAAVGAAVAGGEGPVVAYVGDGSFLMHGLEIATAARHSLPILFVIARNGVHGTVWNASQGPAMDLAMLPPVDLARVVEACGVEARIVHDVEQLRRALEGAGSLRHPRAILATVPCADSSAKGLPTGVGWLDQRRFGK